MRSHARVLVDGERIITDSSEATTYLEQTYETDPDELELHRRELSPTVYGTLPFGVEPHSTTSAWRSMASGGGLQRSEVEKTKSLEGIPWPVGVMRRDPSVTATADYVGRGDREAILHSSKVRTANRPFALYKTRISSAQSSTSARRGR
jgi:hypothetical protein